MGDGPYPRLHEATFLHPAHRLPRHVQRHHAHGRDGAVSRSAPLRHGVLRLQSLGRRHADGQVHAAMRQQGCGPTIRRLIVVGQDLPRSISAGRSICGHRTRAASRRQRHRDGGRVVAVDAVSFQADRRRWHHCGLQFVASSADQFGGVATRAVAGERRGSLRHSQRAVRAYLSHVFAWIFRIEVGIKQSCPEHYIALSLSLSLS
mmetsp:Transcript_14971/g.41474  ORF Transcript_14971/g.41474 Transcript_14971/m.41474 type:complete len:205 (+) Transcript_14971:524-1138(+)